jgi:hypothetical protein
MLQLKGGEAPRVLLIVIFLLMRLVFVIKAHDIYVYCQDEPMNVIITDQSSSAVKIRPHCDSKLSDVITYVLMAFTCTGKENRRWPIVSGNSQAN